MITGEDGRTGTVVPTPDIPTTDPDLQPDSLGVGGEVYPK